ncbi:serine hydrolase domain-containing protein [Cecembia calidifontis]|uniref:CubicO group peptidase (Beta-lactamase class C family) n=1 Tax=Cecembia calidifontis TaxID=1187080 RepID=A0A4Q7PDM9_9BACT|nr:serine hydrolase domain-containing protein [Cecembia calidifontis]RZS98207.1 CubicO group peptidase (beta-lactamase class C family) [Cecembia calidifontis]
MLPRLRILVFVFLLGVLSCSESEEPTSGPSNLYFPPISGNNWERLDPKELNWNLQELDKLDDLLEANGTRAFILLKKGKIVREVYFGRRIANNLPFDQNSQWYWASAGKTLTAFLIGMAQEEGKLLLTDPSTDYLGAGWTSMTREQEKKITIWHQLTMTTGLDDRVQDKDDFSPENLKYLAEPGSRWAYHNAPYTLLDKVLEGATGSNLNQYYRQKLGEKIGMTGTWQKLGYNNVFFSDARSMARFGLLVLAKGEWAGEKILRDEKYFREMVNSSQNLNEGYGYLWWLNKKSTFMVPYLQVRIPGSFAPNAPSDMICGLGKDGQYVCVVPSMDLVLVRLGTNPDDAAVPFTFLDDIWKTLRNIIPSS